MPQKKKLPFVTVGFVAVNVLVYVILEILGNTENCPAMKFLFSHIFPG